MISNLLQLARNSALTTQKNYLVRPLDDTQYEEAKQWVIEMERHIAQRKFEIVKYMKIIGL